MTAKTPQPVHESYRRHRRERARQIILPVALTALLMVALIVLINVATFNQDGDVERWAAISTIWIVIPVMIAGLIFFALLAGLIYLMSRLLDVTPTYTALVQSYVRKAALYARRGADVAVKPALWLGGAGASLRALFGKK